MCGGSGRRENKEHRLTPAQPTAAAREAPTPPQLDLIEVRPPALGEPDLINNRPRRSRSQAKLTLALVLFVAALLGLALRHILADKDELGIATTEQRVAVSPAPSMSHQIGGTDRGISAIFDRQASATNSILFPRSLPN